MVSKLMVFHVLLALAVLEGGGALPTIHFIDALSGKNPPPIRLRIKDAGGYIKGSAQLNPGHDYQISVQVDEVYYVSAVFGPEFAAFHAYEPARDNGRAAVYWKADDEGFSISYDKLKWNKAAYWNDYS